MLRVVVPIVVLVVFVYGLIDAIRTDPQLTKGISKPAWIVVQIVLPVIGAVLWFIIGRPRGTAAAPASYGHPIAPDDDPEFLRNLEIRRRKQAEAERLKKLKEELDAKERKLDGGSGEAHGPVPATPMDQATPALRAPTRSSRPGPREWARPLAATPVAATRRTCCKRGPVRLPHMAGIPRS